MNCIEITIDDFRSSHYQPSSFFEPEEPIHYKISGLFEKPKKGSQGESLISHPNKIFTIGCSVIELENSKYWVQYNGIKLSLEYDIISYFLDKCLLNYIRTRNRYFEKKHFLWKIIEYGSGSGCYIGFDPLKYNSLINYLKIYKEIESYVNNIHGYNFYTEYNINNEHRYLDILQEYKSGKWIDISYGKKNEQTERIFYKEERENIMELLDDYFSILDTYVYSFDKLEKTYYKYVSLKDTLFGPCGSLNKKRYEAIKKIEVEELFIDNKKTYLMKDSRNGLYKIGKSSDPKYREKTLQSEKPDVKLVKVWDDDIEHLLHQEYNEYRLRGEWFKLSKIQVKYICTKQWSQCEYQVSQFAN